MDLPTVKSSVKVDNLDEQVCSVFTKVGISEMSTPAPVLTEEINVAVNDVLKLLRNTNTRKPVTQVLDRKVILSDVQNRPRP